MNGRLSNFAESTQVAEKSGAVRFLLLIAGLGGLIYGIDIGIIAVALPYLQATAESTWRLNAQQISLVVAAVLLGSVLSSLFAGMLADLLGRRAVMALSGVLFVGSIPMIALAGGYTVLLLGRLLQGVSGGLIGVAVPLYLAECLPAKNRGRGTAIFQWLLTVGLVVAAFIGLYYARYVEGVIVAARGAQDAAEQVLIAKDHAWRQIFWVSIIPGVLFTAGALLLAESPRWLFRRGKRDAAATALLRTRSIADAELELREMEETSRTAIGRDQSAGKPVRDPLLSRKYVLPFVIACIILACNQATGVNSILAYVVNILNQAGLPGSVANSGDVAIKVLNCLMTIVAVILVDRAGRKFLLMLGSAGIVACLGAAGLLFMSAEKDRVDARQFFQSKVADDALHITVDSALLAQAVAAGSPDTAVSPVIEKRRPMQLTLVYAYGPFTNVVSQRTDDAEKLPLVISRATTVQKDSVVDTFFRKLRVNPFPDPAEAGSAAARNQKGDDRRGAGRAVWLARRGLSVRLHGVLRGRPRSLRLAGAIRTDAHPDSIERHEHCAIAESIRLDDDRRDLSADGGQPRLRGHVLLLERGNGDLFPHRRLPAAGNEGQDLGRDRSILQRRRAAGIGFTFVCRAIGWLASPKRRTGLRRAGRPRGCGGSARPSAWTRQEGWDATTCRGRRPP